MPYIGAGVSRFTTADGLTVSGNASVSGTTALTGNADFNGDLDVDGTTNLDTTNVVGALTVTGDVTLNDGSPNLRLNDTDTSRFIDILYGTRNATFRNTMASGEDMDTVAPEIIFQTQDDGETREHFRMNKSEAVFNEGSVDLDFRVESNGNANMLFIDGGNDTVGIGKSSNSSGVQLQTSGNVRVEGLLYGADGSASGPSIRFFNAASGLYHPGSDALGFVASGSEAMRIDSSGNVMMGTTDTVPSNNGASGDAGAAISPDGVFRAARSGNVSLDINRMDSDGDIITLRKDGTSIGTIGTEGGDLTIGTGDAALQFVNASNAIRPWNVATNSSRDSATDLGTSGDRFEDIFATNTTIQSSDQNEKQQIASLTTAEITAAKALSKLFKTFKWNSAVTAKGDAARTHAGHIAQEVQTAMSDAGLDAANYAFWCSDTWWETSTDVPAVEADEEAGIEARDAYTRIDKYYTADDAPEGATERTRLGVRYPELLAFIGAATEQRLADIETRLTALEAGE